MDETVFLYTYLIVVLPVSLGLVLFVFGRTAVLLPGRAYN